MLERKGLGIRLVAAIIDGVFASVAVIILAAVLGKVGIILGVLVSLAYPCIEILKSQSPAKMLLKLRVTAEDGGPATREQLIQRSLVRYAPTLASAALALVSLVVPALAMLGNVAVLAIAIALLVLSLKTLETTRQAFWDVRAKTAVMGPAVLQPGFAVLSPVSQSTPPQA